MRKIKLQTLGIELYKFTRMHTTVQLSHFLTNEWKSFMSLSYKELHKRREAIAAMTWRWLKHLSNISTCDPVTDRNQNQDSLIGSLECYHRANWSPIPDWHFLPSMAFKTALSFFYVLSLHSWFGIATCILNNGSALGINVEDSQVQLTLDLDYTLAVPLPQNWRIHGPSSVFNFSNKWSCFGYFVNPTASIQIYGLHLCTPKQSQIHCLSCCCFFFCQQSSKKKQICWFFLFGLWHNQFWHDNDLCQSTKYLYCLIGYCDVTSVGKLFTNWTLRAVFFKNSIIFALSAKCDMWFWHNIITKLNTIFSTMCTCTI